MDGLSILIGLLDRQRVISLVLVINNNPKTTGLYDIPRHGWVKGFNTEFYKTRFFNYHKKVVIGNLLKSNQILAMAMALIPQNIIQIG